MSDQRQDEEGAQEFAARFPYADKRNAVKREAPGPSPQAIPIQNVQEALAFMQRFLDDVEAERDRYKAELNEAHTWLLAHNMCDCEDRGYEGQVRCRFAEVLD